MKYVENIKLVFNLGFYSVLAVLIYRLRKKLGLFKNNYSSVEFSKHDMFFSKNIDTPFRDFKPRGLHIEWFGHIHFDLKTVSLIWNKNHLSGEMIPIDTLKFWKINDFSEIFGDIKGVWELSRFEFLIPLAQHAALGDKISFEKMNNLLFEWTIENPVNQGVNWKCGQEISIRLLHICCALLIQGQTRNVTPTMLRFLSLSVQRVQDTHFYAQAQKNNHGTSEATALYIVGALLQLNGHNAGRSFFRLGYFQLENAESNCNLMVGFNRRFSPLVQTMKQLLAIVSEPKSFVMVMNSSAIPADHWTQDPQTSGGRIIGEACHYIDLMRHLVGAPIVSVQARGMGRTNSVQVTEDKATIVLGFADGSFGTIQYLANGGSSFPKERIEVFTAGQTLQLYKFLKLKGLNWPGFKKQSLWRQDKGQNACAKAFLAAVRNGNTSAIPADELFEVARTTIEATAMLRTQVVSAPHRSLSMSDGHL